jgi:hypothetical protein
LKSIGVAFVGAVADAEKAAALEAAVEEVEVHALVEVLFRAEGVGVVVAGLDIAVDVCGDHGAPPSFVAGHSTPKA